MNIITLHSLQANKCGTNDLRFWVLSEQKLHATINIYIDNIAASTVIMLLVFNIKFRYTATNPTKGCIISYVAA